MYVTESIRFEVRTHTRTHYAQRQARMHACPHELTLVKSHPNKILTKQRRHSDIIKFECTNHVRDWTQKDSCAFYDALAGSAAF